MYGKGGKMRGGRDGKSEDEMRIDRIKKVIESIKDESYSGNGGKRS